jgi:hypothetical protein
MTLDSAPKVIPRTFTHVVCEDEGVEDEWLGSRSTPAKKPEVTTSAAARESLEGYSYFLSMGTGQRDRLGPTLRKKTVMTMVKGRTRPLAT